MKYWRALLWLLPLATVIPLSTFVYEQARSDFSAYGLLRRRKARWTDCPTRFAQPGDSERLRSWRSCGIEGPTADGSRHRRRRVCLSTIPPCLGCSRTGSNLAVAASWGLGEGVGGSAVRLSERHPRLAAPSPHTVGRVQRLPGLPVPPEAPVGRDGDCIRRDRGHGQWIVLTGWSIESRIAEGRFRG